MFSFEWIEGSRPFDVLFGVVTSGICLSVAVPILRWILPRRRVWLFSAEVDPGQRIQLAYGIFCMAMAWTDALCRAIPHDHLSWVHPAFFLTTIIIAVGLGPLVVTTAIHERRRASTAIAVHR